MMPVESPPIGLDDRELIREVATVISFVADQLSRLDAALQAHLQPKALHVADPWRELAELEIECAELLQEDRPRHVLTIVKDDDDAA